ncbi:hypothetical protein EDB92DRAFT_1874936 [Lactarius akahatsu]|uniref:Uncharacterized protein n=1 Tax=Lactarius akahatsu TaxID=416441 RepID=A0AAD4LDN7_9AGAM|nr:hypothetical protein EDB92DRAFT_1874936 [Lactarius akahatsu]
MRGHIQLMVVRAAPCNLILSAMVLRTSDTHEFKGLTDVESMLILPAARLCAALKYLADNPGGDHHYYVGKITSELQLASDILGEYPSTQETPHRIHPVLTVLGMEWMRVAREGRRPSTLENISLESVEESCADLAKKDTNQPPVFYTTDLSALIDRIPKVQHWWNADAKQGERRSNKVKAPAPPGANKDVDPLPRGQPPHGTKRSAAAAVQVEEVPDSDEGGESEPTPREAGKTVDRRVRFKSSDAPPEQRRRLRGDPDSEEGEDTPDELWVARGKDRCDACKQGKKAICEPRWGTRRVSFVCKACARRKKTCNPTRVWRTKVTTLFQTRALPPRRVQIEVTDVPARPTGGAPVIQADDAPQSVQVPSAGTVAVGEKRRRGRDPKAVDTSSRLSAIEASLTALNARFDRTDTDISAIEGHLAALEQTQHELKKMVLLLCGYHAVAAASATPSASTSSTASRTVRFTRPSTPDGPSTSAQAGRAVQHRPPAGRKSGTKRASRPGSRSSSRLNGRA